jgi:hypothetical protein
MRHLRALWWGGAITPKLIASEMRKKLLATQAFVAMCCICGVFSPVPSVAAVLPSDCPSDRRGELPKEVDSLIPRNLGVEVWAQDSVAGSAARMMAVVALPAWHFGEAGCGGARVSDDAERLLIVWSGIPNKYRLIAQTSRLLWPRATAGNVTIVLSASGSMLDVTQSSVLPNGSMSDRFVFSVEDGGRMRLDSRTSESLYYPLAQGGGSPDEIEKLERALARSQEVSDAEGYKANMSYRTGAGTYEALVFAEPRRTFRLRARGTEAVYIEQIDDTPFSRLPLEKLPQKRQ